MMKREEVMAAIHAALRAFLRENVVYLDKEGASGSSNTRAWNSLSDDDRWFGAIIAAHPSMTPGCYKSAR
jgi:hypothetical protein